VTVTHVSTFGAGGGAARAALRLHNGLQSVGVASSVLARRNTDREEVNEFEPSSGLTRQLHRVARAVGIRISRLPYLFGRHDRKDMFTDDRSRFDRDLPQSAKEPDVFNLHWVANFVDVKSFFSATTSPVVWTIHDMNPLTGGCHYAFSCNRYVERCGCCPQLASSDDQDLSRKIYERKRSAFQTAVREGRLHIVSPSRWLAREADRSTLLGDAPIHVIPNSLDHLVFRPREEAETRSSLNIPSENRVILFAAQSPSNRRKGFDLLLDAFGELSYAKNTTLVSIGKDKPNVPTDLNHVHAGYVGQDDVLSRLYSLADLFIIPSRQDNLPSTVMEAMACRTPVVGFNIGGIPDMVRPDETGWLAEAGNVWSLREAIERALTQDEKRQRMAKRCREVIEEEYTLEDQAKQYRSLYRSILN